MEGAGLAHAMWSGADVVALDCEMVEVADPLGGPDAVKDALCRVSVVSGLEEWGFEACLDTWVAVEGDVVDFRTAITGVDEDLFGRLGKISFARASEEVRSLIAGKIVVGHAVWNDLEALKISHPCELVRDTSMYRGLRPPWRLDRLPSLRLLANCWLQEEMHSGMHDSVEDATAALRLYLLHQSSWEYCFGNLVMQPHPMGPWAGSWIMPEAQFGYRRLPRAALLRR